MRKAILLAFVLLSLLAVNDAWGRRRRRIRIRFPRRIYRIHHPIIIRTRRRWWKRDELTEDDKKFDEQEIERTMRDEGFEDFSRKSLDEQPMASKQTSA